MIFKYTEEEGITLLGIVPEAFAENGRNVAIYRPTTVAVSPDGKHIAIGGEPAVPEPTTATLSLLALAGLAARRRRR